MELLIDTNTIYYLTGVSENNKIDIKNLENELKQYKVVISQWSLIEIIANDKITESEKETMLKYIADTGIDIIPIIGTNIFGCIPLNLANIIYDKDKKLIIETVKNGKTKSESDLL